MDGWVGGSQSRTKDCLQQSIKAGLRIAYSNQKTKTMHDKKMTKKLLKWGQKYFEAVHK